MTVKAPVSPYRVFDAVLTGRRALTPHLVRLTFGGPDVAGMACHAPDQRIKILLPNAWGRASGLPRTHDWHAVWKALPPTERGTMRTYTLRRLDARAGLLDVDFVLHGDDGPASAWAARAGPGAAVQIVAPDAQAPGNGRGHEWRPPPGVRRILLLGDETALPALAGILEVLEATRPEVEAFIEVPSAADRLDLPVWPGLALDWLVRDGAPAGAAMSQAVRRARVPLRLGGMQPVEDDGEILWDCADADDPAFYAWVAGESAAVRRIRHYLAGERGIDRKALALMGYWRLGRATE